MSWRLPFSEQGDDAASCREWKKVLDLQPDHARALSFLGIVYLRQGKLGLAQEKFEEAVRLHPGTTMPGTTWDWSWPGRRSSNAPSSAGTSGTEGSAGICSGLVQYGSGPGQPGPPGGAIQAYSTR